MRLGVIADDFTGATDIASFLAQNGLPVIQFSGVPQQDTDATAQALVISLKSRSCPPEQAIAQSLAALAWLQQQGCDRFYFKYCSTFDSTAQGNIGPVTIPVARIEQGAAAVQAELATLKAQGVSYVVLDAISEQHLLTQGAALRDMRLVTGGSGLAIGIARAWASAQAAGEAEAAGRPQGGRAVVIAGSCSQMTNQQVAAYRQQAPAMAISVERCITEAAAYARELCDWISAHADRPLAPMLYATADAQQLQAVQLQYGAARSSEAVEQLFAAVTRELRCGGTESRRHSVSYRTRYFSGRALGT